MRDFKEFLSGELVVQFSSAEELLQFLKLCGSKGLIWFGGDKATEYTPNWEYEGVRFDSNYGHLWKGALSIYEERGHVIVPVAEFLTFRDFQEFKDGKVAVSVKGDTDNEFLKLCERSGHGKPQCLPHPRDNEFLKLCERSGLVWSNGDLPTAITVDDSDFWFIRHTPRGLQRGEKHYYIEMLNVAVADYTEFSYEQDFTVPEVSKDEVVPPIYGYYRVEIVRKGRKVVCREYLNGSVINEGTARCHPDDEFDFKFGSDLAYDRMRGRTPLIFKTVPVKTIVKQEQYAVGDIVQMVEPRAGYNDFANSFLGKEQVITDVFYSDSYGIKGSNSAWSDFEIAGKVIYSDVAKPKFVKKDQYSVGDVVRIKKKWKSGIQNPDGEMDHYLGTNMTVACVLENNEYRMEEDDQYWYWSHKDIKGAVE